MPEIKVLEFPNEFLTKPCQNVPTVDQSVANLVMHMRDTMYSHGGIGLAANQVGYSWRIFIVEKPAVGGKRYPAPFVFINPEFTWLSEETQLEREACLSFPGIVAKVSRHKNLKVKAQNVEGDWYEQEASGLYAQAIQHEMDHLNGVTLLDRVGPVKRDMIRKKLKKALKKRG
jgi:peptide deformylase